MNNIIKRLIFALLIIILGCAYLIGFCIVVLTLPIAWIIRGDDRWLEGFMDLSENIYKSLKIKYCTQHYVLDVYIFLKKP